MRCKPSFHPWHALSLHAALQMQQGQKLSKSACPSCGRARWCCSHSQYLIFYENVGRREHSTGPTLVDFGPEAVLEDLLGLLEALVVLEAVQVRQHAHHLGEPMNLHRALTVTLRSL